MDPMTGGPKLILDHVTGRDEYSDGDVEEDILSFVTSGKDLEEIVRHDDRWAILYHLDGRRRNILEWFPFEKGASLLEIGAGCGALTGLFCEKVKNVTAIEMSPRRAKIIAARYPRSSNLTVFAGSFEDVPLEEKFDYVTLIGVLEYAGRYRRGSAPYVDMLKRAAEALRPGGTLIIALENRFGLKYWAGAPEDHSGKLFQGLEGYPGEEGYRTFGREELIDLLRSSGFGDLDFYYPYPDYKLPDRLYSDRALPSQGAVGIAPPNYDQERFVLFDEGLVSDGVIQNKAFPLISNSFLIICRR
jgi:SAM-dependent methyltransferase